MDMKYGLLSKHLFQTAQQHGGYIKPRGNDKFTYNKECLPVIKRNKKHSLKQVVTIRYTLGKDFLELLHFKVCEMFLFRQSKEVGSILWCV